MDTFIDLYIKSSNLSPKSVIEEINAFSNQSGSWRYDTQASISYSKDIDAPACSINYISNSKIYAVLSIAKKSNRKGVYIANIVPRLKHSLSITEYNTIVKLFHLEFSKYCRTHKCKLIFETSGENVSLEDIIPGITTRSYFERYLNAYPLSFHPLDIKRLDYFICALSRYKSSIDIELLERYLIEVLNWSTQDAEWCTKRISTGLAVLDVRKVFN